MDKIAVDNIRALLITNDRYIKFVTDNEVHSYSPSEVNPLWIQTCISKLEIVKYLGMGNKLFIKSEDDDWLSAKLKSHPDYPVKGEGIVLFQNWLDFYTKG